MADFHYRQLKVWQKAMDLVKQCYKATQSFPAEERYGLTSQIRLAAVSIPANIAEGNSRSHTKEFLNHLSMARGSLAELETLILLSEQLGLLTKESSDALLASCDEISRMISGLKQSLEVKLP
jgi:four helix bundle protein